MQCKLYKYTNRSSTMSIHNEKSVIIRESQEIFTMKDEVLMDLLHEACYSTSGLGLTILGTDEAINRVDRTKLLEYRTNHYTGNRIVISAAGAVDHEEVQYSKINRSLN